MAIWLTSDCHFNHANILKYCPESRPFETIEDMNEVIIKNWNSVVQDDDTVYVLGDFFMGQVEKIKAIFYRLKGHIILIRGNHDTEKRIALYQELGVPVKDIDYLSYKGRFFILCHFPIASPEFVEMVRKDNSEVILLYGHIHDQAPTGYKDGTFHVGVDTNNLTPIALEDIWRQAWPPTSDTKAWQQIKKAIAANPDWEGTELPCE